jgi:hypothetical protein
MTVTYSSLRDVLVAAIAQAPEADIQNQELQCASCKQLAEPRFIEYGFSRDDHRLAGFELGEIRVHRGNSQDQVYAGSNYSEDADITFLECAACGHIYRIPKSMKIRWLSIDES